MKAYGSRYIEPRFLDFGIVGGEWSVSRSGRHTLDTRWLRGCVGPRVGLDESVWTLPYRDSVVHPVASYYTDNSTWGRE
jgi:hypothetical protein